MSVIVTICLRDGIVMAADSRTTLTRTYPDGKQEITHQDGIKKIFQFGARDIGILWCGNARVGDESVSDYLTGLSKRLDNNTRIPDIADIINTECNTRVRGETIRCHIAGYEDGIQCMYQVVDGVITHKNINPDLGIPTLCVVWDGQREVSGKIIHNKEKIDIGNRIVDESDIPTLSLCEGVAFAKEMLRKSCEVRDDCGEPIYSLIITPERLTWYD